MFRRKEKDYPVKIDDVMIIRRNGKKYKQVSFLTEEGRFSTIVDDNVEVIIGETVNRSALRYSV